MTESFLRIKAVMIKTGKSRSAIYADIALSLFPKQILIGQRSVAWLESAVDKWMDSKIESDKAMPKLKLKTATSLAWIEDGNNDLYWKTVNAGKPESEQI